MRPKNHTVWIWTDYEGVVRHVGYGSYDGGHPAASRFKARHDDDSELDLWLRSLDSEPTRKTFGDSVVSLDEAIGFAMGLKVKHAETILKSRGPQSYCGGGPSKGVYYYNPHDLSKCNSFESVRAASRAVGANPSTVSRWCNDKKNEAWGFFDND